MADWTTPKTDWTEDSFINAVDYNRISENLLFLRDLASELFASPQFKTMDEKTVYELIYADEMNAIEDNLTALNLGTWGYDIGEQETYVDNGSMPISFELNRIESAMLRIKTELDYQIATLPILSFVLGNMRGIQI